VPAEQDEQDCQRGRIIGTAPKSQTALNYLKQAKLFTLFLIVLSQTVAVIKAENQVIEEIQYLARGGPDES
jgi:hypothetical protein